MPSNQKTSIPYVPKDTPMFDGDGFQAIWQNLNRTWLIFFERTFKGGAAGPFHRTIDIKDTTVGNDIADHVTVYGPEPPPDTYAVILVTGVLRKTIASALKLRINVVSPNLTSAVVGIFTIPASTRVNARISFNLNTLVTSNLPSGGVLTWDITASDGSKDNAGVATFTILWQ